MSVTCLHLLADASAHPHCAGCRTVPMHVARLARDAADDLARYIVAVDPGAQNLERAVAAELKTSIGPTAPAHRPGARRPGTKPTPPVPRWARDRGPR